MRMKECFRFIISLLFPVLLTPVFVFAQIGWQQWGQNQQHNGFVQTPGQDATSILADIVYDPFTAAEERDTGGELLALVW